MASSGRTRSLDLGIGFAVGLGCGVALAVVVLAGPDEVAEGSQASDADVSAAEAVRPIAVATAMPAARPAEPTPRPVIPPSPAPPAPPVAEPAPQPAAPVAETPSGSPPAVPLPRMPGSTRLSDSARFDPESATWVLKRAFKIHAREHHVLAFYEKALVDAGLRVSREAPAGPGTTYLVGRSDRVAAQVGIRMRDGTLETRVWILWRERT